MTGLAIGALQPGSHFCHMLFQPHCMLTQQSVAWQICCFSLQDLQKEATLVPVSSYCSILLCWVVTLFLLPSSSSIGWESENISPMLENENPANSLIPANWNWLQKWPWGTHHKLSWNHAPCSWRGGKKNLPLGREDITYSHFKHARCCQLILLTPQG